MATLADSLIPLLFTGTFHASGEDESDQPVFQILAIMLAIVITQLLIMMVVKNIKDYV